MNTIRPVFRPHAAPSLATLAVLAVCALPAPAARAQTSGVTLSGGIVDNAADEGVTSFVLGYTFTVTAPVSVTALGFYDDNNTALDFDGNPTPGTAMSQSHQVGIFSDATGALLVQATVSSSDPARAAFNGQTPTPAQAATDGTGVQLFRYDSALKDGATGLVSLPSFLLTPGVTYTLAAVTGADDYDYLPGSDFAGGTFGTGSGVAYGQDRYVDGSASILSDPTGTTGNMPGGLCGERLLRPELLVFPGAGAFLVGRAGHRPAGPGRADAAQTSRQHPVASCCRCAPQTSRLIS